jgi:hypothetical protein
VESRDYTEGASSSDGFGGRTTARTTPRSEKKNPIANQPIGFRFLLAARIEVTAPKTRQITSNMSDLLWSKVVSAAVSERC